MISTQDGQTFWLRPEIDKGLWYFGEIFLLFFHPFCVLIKERIEVALCLEQWLLLDDDPIDLINPLLNILWGLLHIDGKDISLGMGWAFTHIQKC